MAAQAKGCAKIGKLQHIARWIYFICDEHNRLLTYDDRCYIARTLGTQRSSSDNSNYDTGRARTSHAALHDTLWPLA